jgi:hypothetical protein
MAHGVPVPVRDENIAVPDLSILRYLNKVPED